MIADVPNVMHYGLLFEIKDTSYSFDKHWFQTFDALRCPPWEEVAAGERPQHGLLPAPPRPSILEGEVRVLVSFLLACPVCLRSTSFKRSTSASESPPYCVVLQGEALLRDLLSIEVVATLNEALCQNYGRICPPSDQLHRQCDAVGVADNAWVPGYWSMS